MILDQKQDMNRSYVLKNQYGLRTNGDILVKNGTFYPGFIEYRLGEKLSEWLENPNYSQFEKLGGFDFIQDVASTRKHDKHNNSKDQ